MSRRTDTHQALEPVIIKGFRKMLPGQKFNLAMEMSEAIHDLARRGS